MLDRHRYCPAQAGTRSDHPEFNSLIELRIKDMRQGKLREYNFMKFLPVQEISFFTGKFLQEINAYLHEKQLAMT